MKRVSVRDLPERGLSIIADSDPSFESKLQASLKGLPTSFIAHLKRFSVYVVNNGSQPVAALAVNWEFIQSDGQAVSKYKAVRQPNLFHTGNATTPPTSSLDQFSAPVAHALIEPHASRLVSLLDAAVVRSKDEVRLTKDSVDVPEQVRLQDRYTADEVSRLNKMIEKSVSWNVSIDGAFFEDGTFVGPDKTGFFYRIKAESDARLDLLTDIASLMIQPGSARGDSDDAVFGYVQSVAGSGRPRLSGFAANDFYKHRKSIFALQILTNRKTLGDKRAIELIREQLKEPRIQLIKR